MNFEGRGELVRKGSEHLFRKLAFGGICMHSSAICNVVQPKRQDDYFGHIRWILGITLYIHG
jgi:hypothetical protein